MGSLLLSAGQRKCLDQATITFEKQRCYAQTYLDGRGISPEAATEFRLGLVAESPTGYE